MPGNRAIEGHRNLLEHECERCTPTGCKRVSLSLEDSGRVGLSPVAS